MRAMRQASDPQILTAALVRGKTQIFSDAMVDTMPS